MVNDVELAQSKRIPNVDWAQRHLDLVITSKTARMRSISSQKERLWPARDTLLADLLFPLRRT